jgi:hypothetical protein
MATTEATIIDTIENALQDSSNATWSAAELRYYKDWALRELAKYVPYKRIETLSLESRTGTASSTTTSALVDATKSQFVSTDADKVIYNTTDKTWAIVTAYVSASQLTLSSDIMASGEGYEIYNRYCFNSKQLDLSPVDDWLSIDGAEYPYGEMRGVKVMDGGKVLELEYDGYINDTDTDQTSSQRDILVHLNTIHRLPNLTDTAGAVNNAGGYAAGSTSMAINSLSGTETIPQHTLFTIASVRGVYRTTAALTLSGGGGTISFFPGLLDAAVNTDVVTIVASTLTPSLEEALIELIVAKALIEKSNKYLNSSTFNKGAWANFQNVGQSKMADIRGKLARMSLRQSILPART